jgi:hypothetical protein
MKGNTDSNIKGGLLVIKYGYDMVSRRPTGVVDVDPHDRVIAEEFLKEYVPLNLTPFSLC